MHRFYIGNQHLADHRLNIADIAFPVISERVGCQIPDNIFNPEIEPLINRRIGSHKYIVMLIGVLCVLNPVPRLGQRLKILLMPLPGSINKSCAIQSVLSLVDTLTAVFSLEILSHGRAPFPQRRKEHTTTLYSIAHGALFLKASPRIFQMQCQITRA